MTTTTTERHVHDLGITISECDVCFDSIVR